MQQWLNWRAVRHFQMEILLQHWRDACFKGMSLCLSPCPDLLSTEPCLCFPSLLNLYSTSLCFPLSRSRLLALSRVITFPLCWFASAIEFSLSCSLCRLGWKPTEDNWNFLTDCWKILLKGRNIKDNKTYLSFLPVNWGRVKWLCVSNRL